MVQRHLMADLSSILPEPLRLAYLDQAASEDAAPKGTTLLVHGFPQTSHQFRNAIPLHSAKGYKRIAPDYPGAGASSKDVNDFRKPSMAGNMVALLDHLGSKEPVHVVGHDVGGMIAYSIAARFPNRVRNVIWGECPLPGTPKYVRDKTENAVQPFHFIFHSVSPRQGRPSEQTLAGNIRPAVSMAYHLSSIKRLRIDVIDKAMPQRSQFLDSTPLAKVSQGPAAGLWVL